MDAGASRFVGRSEKVAERVAKRIVADIVQQNLQPGDMLPSETLMLSEYGVGRASLREALRLLEQSGVIRVKAGPRGGPMVSRPDVADFARSTTLYFQFRGGTLEQVLEARLILEPMMARMAADRIDEEGAAELQRQISRGRLALDHSPSWGPTNAEFHEAVALLSGNVVLDLFSNSLANIQNQRITPVFPSSERQEVAAVHERIAKAIISGASDRAEKLMRRHIEAIIDRLHVAAPATVADVLRWE
jgi:GntR family transcriptional regulator, transcriptional repressor for pyruvate dehydrogenase complex